MKRFEVDRCEGKLMGVCAGLGKAMGVDPTIVRIGFVVATIVGGWPWTVVAYFALGFFGQPGGARLRQRSKRAGIAGGTPDVRDLDRRLAEIDTYVASPNSRLAREIEDLR
ncbi:MAG TPA: PspC domain-containing protein [Allosphingosinicella sp.]|nr:PspC domain-containing protein [Allosphingosinicella sp.]